MSASVDILDPERPKRIVIVASNPAVSGQTGWPIGFWWAELSHPYLEFTEHGYEVDVASPEGGVLQADYEGGKATAVICHATCALLRTQLASGRLLVDGKTWTGFANSEERFVDDFVGQKVQPFWIEDEAHKLEDTNFIVSGRFKPHAVRDGNLITGQQQYSGRAAARLMIEALGI